MINVLPLLFLSTLSWTIEADKAPLVDPSMIRNLMSEPVVIMVTDFDEYSSQTFSLRMIEAIQSKEPIIPIVIDSYGGSVYALLHMIDAILVAPVPVATICIGKCMSAGALLLAAGTDGRTQTFRPARRPLTLPVHLEILARLCLPAHRVARAQLLERQQTQCRATG